MMNTETATAKTSGLPKLLSFALRFTWATAIFAVKLSLILFALVMRLLTSGRDDRSEDDDLGESDVKYKFSSESKYEAYKNQTRF